MSPALTLSTSNTFSIPEHRPHTDGFGTRAIHVGSEANPETGAVIPSISLSTTYKQDSIGVHKGFEYSRSGNPNRNAFESTLASVEAGGAHALAFSSGSATTATLIQSLGPNAHILSVNDVYGGTFRYMTKVASLGQGVTTTFLDLEDVDVDSEVEDKILDAVKENTRLVWIETPTNPTLRVIDVKRVVQIIRSHPLGENILVLVDNTFLSPYYQSPLLLGADLVMHSITKYINGHSDVVMGALILPERHEELANRLRFYQNAIGAVPSPYDCWLAQRGLKTLHLRMKQHGVNALKIARWLEKEKEKGVLVEDVIYPGLSSHRKNDVAWKSLSPHAKKWIEKEILVGRVESPVISASSSQEDLTRASSPAGSTSSKDDAGFPYGGMISFRIPGSFAQADKFLSSLRLFTLAESLGGVESLAEHPARMTHGSIPPRERELLGIGENLIRLSVGVEEVEDLIEDLRQALEKARLVDGQEKVVVKQH